MRLIVALILLAGCGDDSGSIDAGSDSSFDASFDVSDAFDPSDVGPDAMPPMDVQPCAGDASCFEALDVTPTRCGTATHSEDYSSGRYNVHGYASRVFPGADTVVSITRTAGSFAPAIIVHDAFGRTLSDGERGLEEPMLRVAVESSGRGSDEARVRVSSDVDRELRVYVTGWTVVDSGFADFLGTSVTYDARAESDCGIPPIECVVAGSTVAEPACGWLRFIGARVVDDLEGTREERLETAARVAWWSLKEGVLFLDNPIVYSNCNFPSGDMRIGPLDVCIEGRAWQVGLSAIQVPTFNLGVVEETALRLHPEDTLESLLAQTALDALLSPEEIDVVVESSGDLRRSWLLRDSATGFTLQVGRVSAECIDDERVWCYGTGWEATRLFAPDRATALQAVVDIRDLFDAVAP